MMARLQRTTMRGGIDLLEDVQCPVSTTWRTVIALHAASGVGESCSTVVKESVATYIAMDISDIELTRVIKKSHLQ